jgi:hypothetical protein
VKPKPEIPDGPVGRPEPDKEQGGPLIAWAGSGDGEAARDVTKPIAYDEQGRPLFAPRGITFRLD